MNIKRKYKIVHVLRYYVDYCFKAQCMLQDPLRRDLPSEKVYVPEFQSFDGSWNRWTKKPLSMWFMEEPPVVFFEHSEDAESFIRKEHEEFVKWHEKYDDECVKEFEL